MAQFQSQPIILTAMDTCFQTVDMALPILLPAAPFQVILLMEEEVVVAIFGIFHRIQSEGMFYDTKMSMEDQAEQEEEMAKFVPNLPAITMELCHW